ncbi:MAG: M42 family metallopeptidase [Chloroflexaceae bacterium]|nr:M42 family metallopeptidase [Chloroflexaceae bacterium]
MDTRRTDTLQQLLQELSQVSGAPGQEQPVRQVMQRYLEPLGEVLSDNLGGIACRKVGQADGPKIMLAGHMDEVGFLVRRITRDGFLKFQPLGGWSSQVLLSHRVEVSTRNGPLVGVIGAKPRHLTPPEERQKLIEPEEMYIDIGASSAEEAMAWGVRPGDPIVPISPLTVLHNEKLLMAKAWDNRVGCALVIEVLRRMQHQPHPNIIYGVATVQEEIGLRGAKTMANLVAPDIGLILEGCPAADTPDVSFDESTVALGRGPAISLYDRSMVPHVGLRNLVMDCAEAQGIPIQYRVSRGGTDGGEIHLSGKGVPSLVVSVPARYIHSHNAILHLDDVVQTARLMVAVVHRLDAGTVARIKQ